MKENTPFKVRTPTVKFPGRISKLALCSWCNHTSITKQNIFFGNPSPRLELESFLLHFILESWIYHVLSVVTGHRLLVKVSVVHLSFQETVLFSHSVCIDFGHKVFSDTRMSFT